MKKARVFGFLGYLGYLGMGAAFIGATPGCAPAPSSHSSNASPAKSAEPIGLSDNSIIADAVLPNRPDDFAPSQMLLRGTKTLSGRDVVDVDRCEPCHADVVLQWKSSAHSFASLNNPIYRFSVDRFRAETNAKSSRFCGGCHDIALMVDGAMDEAEIKPEDYRAHAGVSCMSCHSVESVRPDGNGSYTLTTEPLPVPETGNANSLKAHIERAAQPVLKSAGLCIACHRAFLNEGTGNKHFLIGQDDGTPWQRSPYAGSNIHRIDEQSVENKSCRECHMPMEEAPRGDAAATEEQKGKVASHRFAGGHTWLASMRGDSEQLKATQAMLSGAASLDIAVASFGDGRRHLPADGAPIKAGERITLDVVVRNLSVGHRFPGGVMDAQDVWIELLVSDKKGKPIAEAGLLHEKSGADPEAHRLMVMQAGDDGKPLFERQTHLFRAPVFNSTLLPRDAAVVQYALEIPAALSADRLPLRVEAKLRHRTRNLDVFAAACKDARSPRGMRFRKLSPRSDLDPCAPQPVTEIAMAEVFLGSNTSDGLNTKNTENTKNTKRPAWKRMYEHGLGMLSALQERLDEGRPSLMFALSELEKDGSAQEKAMVMGALAELAARQGRVDEAMEWLEKVQALLPGHPAPAYTRGKAHALVWRWADAARFLGPVAMAAPGDDSVWAALAVARGSAGDDAGALLASVSGLKIQPRDQDMLRVQALSLSRLSVPTEARDAAFEAWRGVQTADEIPYVKGRCSMKVPGCANERNPVHAHLMRALP